MLTVRLSAPGMTARTIRRWPGSSSMTRNRVIVCPRLCR
nr:hypothetical protein RVX_1135 [Nitratidesulfovibrio sp. HK-II]